MKGLLLKDLYMVKKYGIWSFLVSLLFIVASLMENDNTFFMFYPCILCGMIPISILSYDEKSRWEKYCGTLPYTKAQIVSSKYLTGLFIQLTVMLITVISHGIKMGTSGDFRFENLAVVVVTNVAAFAFPSISLPFVFKYGAEDGRFVAIVMMVALFSVVGFLTFRTISLSEADIQMEFDTPVLFAVVCLAAAVLYALSWLLSIAFYKKREIG